jgi:transcription elongation factor GreA
MAEKATHLTKDGLKKLELELDELKGKRRMEIARQIEEARSHGDLSENSDYDEAKRDQADNENRIAKLENILRNYVLIDESQINTEEVGLGVKVVLLDIDSGDEEEYFLVGSTEANPMEGRISNESPVGDAIMGHKKEDIVEVNTPDGYITYKIIDIHR